MGATTNPATPFGPTAEREFANADDAHKATLTQWLALLPVLDDYDFFHKAASAIHDSALVNGFRGNWDHEHCKASAAYSEAQRRHREAGHSEDSPGTRSTPARSLRCGGDRAMTRLRIRLGRATAAPNPTTKARPNRMPNVNRDEITAALHRRADEGISGADALAWLKRQGLDDTAARKLCAEVIIARRPARAEVAEVPEVGVDAVASAAIEADGLTVGPEMRKALLAGGWLPPNDAALIRRIAEIAWKNGEQVDPGAILDVIGYGDDQ